MNAPSQNSPNDKQLRAGMVGMGMIFDETYRPFFEQVYRQRLYDCRFGDIDVFLAAVATRTGRRAEKDRGAGKGRPDELESYPGDGAVGQMLQAALDFACGATPDDRHFEPAKNI